MIIRMIKNMMQKKNDSKIEPDIFVDKDHWFRVLWRSDFATQTKMFEEARERGYDI